MQVVEKRLVKWTPILGKNVRGLEVDHRFPDLVDLENRGTLIDKILRMEPKNPMSFDAAIHLAQREWSAAFQAGDIGQKPGQCIWYSSNFVEWIADKGFHIELSGDEFEHFYPANC